MLSSAVLLIASFPNWNQPWCAWLALVPWLLALQDLGTRQAFWWSYLIGALFFLGSIWWLIHVTFVGLIVLCAYLALSFGLFGWLARKILHLESGILHLVLIPAAWVALEYARSHLLSGFGWNLLGYSQTPSLSAIQLADVTGVWGVSFVVVMMNVAITMFVAGRDVRKTAPSGILAAALVFATWLYGQYRLKQPEPGARMRVAILQGNIPQEEKWDETFKESILQRYERFTHEAATHNPQLIIWPETSVPGYLGLDEPLTSRMQQVVESVKVPLLVGAPMGRPQAGSWQLTNSAVLLDPAGAIVSRYDKLHLVPFGEFVPFESVFPWLRAILPPIGDFVPGHEFTVFRLDRSRFKAPGDFEFRILNFELDNPQSAIRNPQLAFSVLICFEDIFPDLARQFVQRGARLLVTITNDAWFGNSAAAYQHAQASTFRAVELRVPMVRAANTGWSGCIDTKGRWVASVRNRDGEELFIEGIASCELALGESDTVYRRWGDWFAWLCGLLTVGWIARVSKQSIVHRP